MCSRHRVNNIIVVVYLFFSFCVTMTRFEIISRIEGNRISRSHCNNIIIYGQQLLLLSRGSGSKGKARLLARIEISSCTNDGDTEQLRVNPTRGILRPPLSVFSNIFPLAEHTHTTVVELQYFSNFSR